MGEKKDIGSRPPGVGAQSARAAGRDGLTDANEFENLFRWRKPARRRAGSLAMGGVLEMARRSTTIRAEMTRKSLGAQCKERFAGCRAPARPPLRAALSPNLDS